MLYICINLLRNALELACFKIYFVFSSPYRKGMIPTEGCCDLALGIHGTLWQHRIDPEFILQPVSDAGPRVATPALDVALHSCKSTKVACL